MKKTILILLSILFIAVPTWAEEKNYCHDKATWADWDKLIAANPHDIEIKTLNAIRIGFCNMIDRGQATVEEGTQMFESYREALLKRREKLDKKHELTL